MSKALAFLVSALLARAADMEFVQIQPGEFLMGCAPADADCQPEAKPQHRVRITRLFEIGKYEVTQAQWEAVMQANPSYFRGADRPVEQVDWTQVQEFLTRLNAKYDGYRYRLPTEAEWEYCARAGSTAQHGAVPLSDAAWYGAYNGHTLTDTPGETRPVGQKSPNAWGLYDTLGNVQEWVADWYSNGYYSSGPSADPTGPAQGQYHVARGGTWYSIPRYLRVWNRYQTVRVLKRRDTGFRVVRESLDHVMIVVPGATFTMGSPPTERGRAEEELQHQVRIPRTYAIATTEVTNQQFETFLASDPAFARQWRSARTARFGDPPRLNITPQAPQVAVSWYDAARYCNWLSAKANIPKSQWAYPENIDPERGFDLPPDYLHRTGYRLPTEAEWEFAARAGAATARHFGDDETALARYAWYDANSKEVRSHPVATLLPNQWGLYDMLGNVWEWTLDRRQPYPQGPSEDIEDADLHVSNEVARTRRGGSYSYEWFTVRSAHRGATTYFPNQTRDSVGFRVARTMP